MKYLIFAIVLSISNIASASDWKLIDPGNPQNTDSYSLYYDAATLKKIPYGYKVWIMKNFSLQKQNSIMGCIGTNYVSIKSQWVLNCESKEVGVQQDVYYGENGDVTCSLGNSSSKVLMSEVIPDSAGEGMLSLICSKAKKQKQKASGDPA